MEIKFRSIADKEDNDAKAFHIHGATRKLPESSHSKWLSKGNRILEIQMHPHTTNPMGYAISQGLNSRAMRSEIGRHKNASSKWRASD
jgi:hypothetical protein